MLTRTFVVTAIRADAEGTVAVELGQPASTTNPTPGMMGGGLTLQRVSAADAADFPVHQVVTLTLAKKVV